MLVLSGKAKKSNPIFSNSVMSPDLLIPDGNEMSEHHKKEIHITEIFSDLKKYITSNGNKLSIKWVLRKGQGLANNLRSIRGILLLAIVNNANICVEYDNYFSVMNETLLILKCQNRLEYEFWPEGKVISWIKRQQCNYYLSTNTSIATCYDLSYYFSHCKNYIPDISKHIDYKSSRHYLEYISSFIFQPKNYILHYASSVISSMKGIIVGIQLRFGGQVANSKEGGKFLNPNSFNLVINQLKRIFSEIHHPFNVFLSSDSQKAEELLKPLNISCITANKYQIGHSGRSATMDRAVTDIYILSRCDILIYTFRSSYGRFARDLSKSDKIYVLKTSLVCVK